MRFRHVLGSRVDATVARMETRAPRLGPLGIAAALLLVPLSAPADPTKVGSEIVVHDVGESYGYTPRIAVDPAGNFLVAWLDPSADEVRARAFWAIGNPRGPLFTLSEPGFEIDTFFWDTEELLSAAADGAGNFVVAYNGYDPSGGEPACSDQPCILTKRYESDGNLSTATFIVGDPRLFTYDDYYNPTANPELAGDGEGNFVVAWEGYDADPGSSYLGSEGVWARKLVNVGQVNGSQFRVNALTPDYQGDAGTLDVAADAVGNFVLVWEDDNDLAAPPSGGIVFRRFDKAKNPVGLQTPVVGCCAGDPHVAQAPDGEFMITWVDHGGSGVSAQAFDASGLPASPMFQVAAGAVHPEIAASGADTFVVVYETSGGDAAGKTFALDGSSPSAEFIAGTDGYYPAVGAAENGDFVVTWTNYDSTYAQRFQESAPTSQEIPLLGKVLVLTNKDPDDFEKSKGSWKASGEEIVSPLRGSANDPRCNGDPDGTVKATVRFLSATSGQDVTLPLPCQNWSVTGGNKVGSVPTRGYKYKDPAREQGPCVSVKLKGTKSLTVSCKGKKGAAGFPYDLVLGQNQGSITAVLEMGLIKHCAEFLPLFDGSDGKKYKGKSLAMPAACP